MKNTGTLTESKKFISDIELILSLHMFELETWPNPQIISLIEFY